MTETPATTTSTLPTTDVIARVLLDGDLAKLSPPQRLAYYKSVCESLGLNPLTKPFEYLRLSGREVLYATRNATDQLRQIHAVSVAITAREVVDDTYVVTARATLPNGRADESIGAVPIGNLKGESRANAMMKCETKSKRRVTLSLIGLSMLDESEVESIPGAEIVSPEPKSAPENFPKLTDPLPTAGLPDTWKPFAEMDRIRGHIVEGKRSSRNPNKITAILDGGASVVTLDPTIGAEVQAAKLANALVEIQTKPTGLGREIVAITRVPDDMPL